MLRVSPVGSNSRMTEASRGRPVGFFLRVLADKTLDALSSLSACFGLSLRFRPGKPLNSPWEVAIIYLFLVLNPTKLGATIVVAQGQMPDNFLPSPDADCLPFLVKLVRVEKNFRK